MFGLFGRATRPLQSHLVFRSLHSSEIHRIQRSLAPYGKFTNYIKSLLPSAIGKIENGEPKKTPDKIQGVKRKWNRKRKKGPPNLLNSLESPEHMPDFLFDVLPKKKNHNQLPKVKFESYISEDEYKLKAVSGDVLVGIIRINPRNYRLAYISSPDGVGRDIIIDGVEARNRAFPGDLVAVELLPQENWRDEGLTKTGKVVYLVEEKHSRVACGFLRTFRNNRFGFALFSPTDRRLPRLMIPLSECPENFENDSDSEKTLYVARITGWDKNIPFANGKVTRFIGKAGLIGPETDAILLNNDIDSSDFQESVLKTLPNVKTWKVTKKEVKKRRDLRNECVFTIDPPTARDLDDALSCKRLDDDVYEVGVHIADVSHFIQQNTQLDKVARNRATSVYLTQMVIPMLPRTLCEELCSLNPGVERLTYSVIWKMRSDGTILDEWFGRTVIKSCTKLAYHHAQTMIEAYKSSDLCGEDFPEIQDRKFSITKISDTVKVLYNISRNLRSQRFSSGALDFSETDIAFNLDEDSGMPNGCYLYEYKDSNKLIEEFMLLANMSVGHKIYKHHPKKAVLRCHPPPHDALIKEVGNICQKFDIPFDISNSGSVNKSLEKIAADVSEDQEKQNALLPALNFLCMKSFRNAKYFCTGSVNDESLYRHYALNIPIYTHFTSPIRRYPDILVHRLLTASLDEGYQVKAKTEEIQMWAEHCTARKLNADVASEQSSSLFLAVYIMEHGPVQEKGVVVNVLENSVDVLCPQVGNVLCRIYLNDINEATPSYVKNDEKPQVTLEWNMENSDEREAQLLTMFSKVKISLSVNRNSPSKIIGSLINPLYISNDDAYSHESLKDQAL